MASGWTNNQSQFEKKILFDIWVRPTINSRNSIWRCLVGSVHPNLSEILKYNKNCRVPKHLYLDQQMKTETPIRIEQMASNLWGKMKLKIKSDSTSRSWRASRDKAMVILSWDAFSKYKCSQEETCDKLFTSWHFRGKEH